MLAATNGTKIVGFISCYPGPLYSPGVAYGPDHGLFVATTMEIVASQETMDIISSDDPPLHTKKVHQSWLLNPTILLTSCLLEVVGS